MTPNLAPLGRLGGRVAAAVVPYGGTWVPLVVSALTHNILRHTMAQPQYLVLRGDSGCLPVQARLRERGDP